MEPAIFNACVKPCYPTPSLKGDHPVPGSKPNSILNTIYLITTIPVFTAPFRDGVTFTILDTGFWISDSGY